MGIRSFLAEHPGAGIGLAVALIGVCVLLITADGATAPADIRPGYYDVGTGLMFDHQGAALPPVTAPSGRKGVWAHIFTCGSCDTQSERFVGFLEQYTDEGKAFADRGGSAAATSGGVPSPEPPPLPPPTLISAADHENLRWFASDTGEAQQVLRILHKRCADKGKLRRCSSP